ncbi:acyl-CoA dehydrogenase [Helicobacter apodemus]|uniref:Acyl-CoA dehydrogenase n=1 Tax=Helicobacter apodemus TaxID=135569 RepID=A0A4U8UHJ3_9HELI|nr:acyl-CoA/acyl-ACP dehydrogenase [Helicobacter apodemus]TLE17241.1 acyl-CoA dehydrogenase [Helicobacter apodemus]
MLESILKDLKGQTLEIHKGFYPKETLQKLGENGFYTHMENHYSLHTSIQTIMEISKICGNTGFCLWCHKIFIWYLKHSSHIDRSLYYKAIKGEILGGTGLSNPIKSFAKIESIKLKAQKVEGGFILNGVLPYVSNVDWGHYFGIIAAMDSTNSQDFIMGLIVCDKNRGIKLKEKLNFCALEGSSTKSVVLKDYFLEELMILSNPASALLPKILPGFVLLQAGIGLGLINAALEMIQSQQQAKGNINTYLPFDNLQKEYKKLLNLCEFLSHTPYGSHKIPANITQLDKNFFACVLNLKTDIANLCLESAKTCMLTYGTKGYLEGSKAHKLLLESYFIAMVTPSTKHIAKLLHTLY